MIIYKLTCLFIFFVFIVNNSSANDCNSSIRKLLNSNSSSEMELELIDWSRANKELDELLNFNSLQSSVESALRLAESQGIVAYFIGQVFGFKLFEFKQSLNLMDSLRLALKNSKNDLSEYDKFINDVKLHLRDDNISHESLRILNPFSTSPVKIKYMNKLIKRFNLTKSSYVEIYRAIHDESSSKLDTIILRTLINPTDEELKLIKKSSRKTRSRIFYAP